MAQKQNQNQNAAAAAQEQLPMNVEVRIHALRTGSPVLAEASATLNSCFAVRGLRVMAGSDGPFVSMPAYKSGGNYRDVCFPVTKEFRQQFQEAVLAAYRQELSQLPQQQEQRQEQAAPEMRVTPQEG